MTDIYLPTDPFALQRGEKVQARPLEGDTALCAVVNLVDTANFYVSVIFEGAALPVALPSDDWLFETLQSPDALIPQDDGLYAAAAEVAEGTTDVSAIYRRSAGVWTNILAVDPSVQIAPEDLPPLAPFRAFAPPPRSTPTTTNPVVPPSTPSPEETP